MARPRGTTSDPRSPGAVFCLCGTAIAMVVLLGCSTKRHEPAPGAVVASAVALVATGAEAPPRVLYLPDAAPPSTPAPASSAPAVFARPARPGPPRALCPPEMVSVRSAFCIDRYEASLVERDTGRPLSPYYHPTPEATRRDYERWQRLRLVQRPAEGRTMPVPVPPEWSLSARRFDAMAVSVAGAVPSGYQSAKNAADACEHAGKRLCTIDEWVTACRGEKNRKFPYGASYSEGRCNVCRPTHPARLLHGDSSAGHLDPRLNQVCEGTDPLLRPAGGTDGCMSEWGADGVYDMVGNLDEWVADPDGTFVGGFYARSTREGCDARVEAHASDYYDYSLGARCCTTR